MNDGIKLALVAIIGFISLYASFYIGLIAGLALWVAGVALDGASTSAFLKKGYKEANFIFNFLLKRLRFGYALLVFVSCIELPIAVIVWFLLGKPAPGFAMLGVAHLIAGLENYGFLK